MARGGARPNSGPKPIAEQVCRIKDIQRCWDVVMQFVMSDAPLAQRAEMASKIAVKAVPQDVNLGGQPNNPLGVTLEIVLNEDKSNTKTVERI